MIRMGILHERCRCKIEVAYTLFGISADVSQLARSYLRGEKKGVKRNVTQIIKKLEKAKKSL